MTISNDPHETLCELIKVHGLDSVQTALEEIDCDKCQPELAIVRSPDLMVSPDGQFYWCRPETGLVSAQGDLEFSRHGKPGLTVDGFTYWLHDQVYRAFVDCYDGNEFTVCWKDGDVANCHVDNLMLVKQPWNFQKNKVAHRQAS